MVRKKKAFFPLVVASLDYLTWWLNHWICCSVMPCCEILMTHYCETIWGTDVKWKVLFKLKLKFDFRQHMSRFTCICEQLISCSIVLKLKERYLLSPSETKVKRKGKFTVLPNEISNLKFKSLQDWVYQLVAHWQHRIPLSNEGDLQSRRYWMKHWQEQSKIFMSKWLLHGCWFFPNSCQVNTTASFTVEIETWLAVETYNALTEIILERMQRYFTISF